VKNDSEIILISRNISLSSMIKTVVLLNIFCGNHDAFYQDSLMNKFKWTEFIWNRKHVMSLLLLL